MIEVKYAAQHTDGQGPGWVALRDGVILEKPYARYRDALLAARRSRQTGRTQEDIYVTTLAGNRFKE